MTSVATVPHAGEALSIAMIGTRGVPSSYGGVERAVEELAAELSERGHDVTVYSRSAYADANVSSYRGIAVRSLPQINTKHLEAASHSVLALASALRTRQFDLIHLHATGPGALSLFPRIANRPTVVTVHGLDWQRQKWGRGARTVLRAATRVCATVPDRTIVVSKHLRQHFAKTYGTNAIYIPNGVTFDADTEGEPVEGLKPDEFVLFLGRLVPEKGLHTLIDAFGRLETDKSLAIVGPSSHTDDYVEAMKGLARNDPRIVFLGPRYGAQKQWLLDNAALFVQPSTLEGLPITLLEAMAAGTFAVVSGIPENVEVLMSDGRRLGSVFRAGDPSDLCRVIDEALSSPERTPTAEAGSEAVRAEYDWATIAEATEGVYYDAVRSHARHLTKMRNAPK